MESVRLTCLWGECPGGTAKQRACHILSCPLMKRCQFQPITSYGFFVLFLFPFCYQVLFSIQQNMSLPGAHLVTHSNIIPKTSFSHTHSVCTLSLSTHGLWCGQGRVHAKEACLHKTLQREPLKEHTVQGKVSVNTNLALAKHMLTSSLNYIWVAQKLRNIHIYCILIYRHERSLVFAFFEMHLNLHGSLWLHSVSKNKNREKKIPRNPECSGVLQMWCCLTCCNG